MTETLRGSACRELPERVDVVVVGGGIAGTSTAYHLAARGADVLLMERGSVALLVTGGAPGEGYEVFSPARFARP